MKQHWPYEVLSVSGAIVLAVVAGAAHYFQRIEPFTSTACAVAHRHQLGSSAFRTSNNSWSMKPHWPKATVAAIIVGLGIVLSAVFRPPEPVCQGKPLSFWVSQLDPYAGPHPTAQPNKDGSLPIDTVRPGLVAAIQTIGPKAVPFLLPKVRHDFSPVRIGSRIIRSRLPARMQRRFTGLESADYSKTAVALSLLGPAAMPGDAAVERSVCGSEQGDASFGGAGRGRDGATGGGGGPSGNQNVE